MYRRSGAFSKRDVARLCGKPTEVGVLIRCSTPPSVAGGAARRRTGRQFSYIDRERRAVPLDAAVDDAAASGGELWFTRANRLFVIGEDSKVPAPVDLRGMDADQLHPAAPMGASPR